MSWFMHNVPERVCTYLMQRYLGQFFAEKLVSEQLTVTVNFYQGIGSVEKVSLDVQVSAVFVELIDIDIGICRRLKSRSKSKIQSIVCSLVLM